MARLDPKRNLPPASEAWGKTIEQRLSYLERANTLLQSEINNTSKGLNSLITRVGSLSIVSDSTGLHSNDVTPETGAPDRVTSGRTLPDSDYYMAPGPTLEVDTRSGRVVVIGQFDVGVYAQNLGAINVEAFLNAGISIYDESGTNIVYPISQFPFNNSIWTPRSSNRAGTNNDYSTIMTYMFASGPSTRELPAGKLTFEPTMAAYNLDMPIRVYFSGSVLTVISL